MAQGNWLDQNFVTDSVLLPRTRRAYVPNGYSTTPPSYNPYSIQFMRTDYTQPIQTSQTPINQALTEDFVQTTDYNGQPAENALIKNLTEKSLGDWAVPGARRASPKVAGALVGDPVGAVIPWIPEAVEGTKYLLSTPAAKTLGNGIRQVINWGL